MQKILLCLCALFSLLFFAGIAQACGPDCGAGVVTFIEDFEGPFPTWESGWLGTNSNLENAYVRYNILNPGSVLLQQICPGGPPYNNCRGSCPDGLWISDGDMLLSTSFGGMDPAVDIVFDKTFGDALTSLSIDVASFVPGDIWIFDKDGNLLLSGVLTDQDETTLTGGFVDPGVYDHFSVNSSNGISGFSFYPGNPLLPIEMLLSIDNVVVTAGTAGTDIPEPSTMLLIGSGLIGLAGYGRKKFFKK